MQTQKMTQEGIAKELGVATSTVQRALAGSSRISHKTRRWVMQAAERHGYEVNVMARGLRTRRTRTLGVVFGRMMPNHVATFSGIEQEANRRGYSTMLAVSDFDRETEHVRVRQLLDRAVDAFIISSIDSRWSMYEKLVHDGRPVVFNGPVEMPSVGPAIQVDEEAASRDVTQHLIDMGHQRIGYIDTAHLRSPAISNRPIHGYRNALALAGIAYDPDLVYRAQKLPGGIGENRLMVYENGYEGLRELLNRCHNMTALICHGDTLCAGAIGAANELKLRIPDDLSIAASDGDYLPPLLTPTVTGLVVPHLEIGKLLADQAIDRLENPDYPQASNSLFPAKLVVRQSTGPAPDRKGGGNSQT
jgi:DNA-binding LacI/PurR family transcriptional regulator